MKTLPRHRHHRLRNRSDVVLDMVFFGRDIVVRRAIRRNQIGQWAEQLLKLRAGDAHRRELTIRTDVGVPLLALQQRPFTKVCTLSDR